MTTAVQKAPVDPAIGAAIDVYNRINAIRNVLAPDLNDQELQLFAMVAERSRLDPFAKQIYAIKRKGRVTFQTGIDGFRSSAEDTNEYRGSDEPEFGPMVDKPFPHPEWAKVIVHRQFANGEWLHQPATAYFDEFYPGDGEASFNWRKMPRNQLAKCAEAAAFRKAFPKRFSDVYTPEEMAQGDSVEAARPVGPTVRDRVAQRRAELEAQAGGSEASPVADRSQSGDVEAPEVQAGTTCPIASPNRLPCLVAGPHTEHVNGVRRWPTPKQASASEGQRAQGQERAVAVAAGEPRQEEAAGVGSAPAADLIDQARQVFRDDIVEGEVVADPVPDDVQAGLDLLPADYQKKGGR